MSATWPDPAGGRDRESRAEADADTLAAPRADTDVETHGAPPADTDADADTLGDSRTDTDADTLGLLRARLEDIDATPMSQRAALFEEANAVLAAELASLDEV